MDTEGKCPTPALLTDTSEAVLDPERWKHHCEGILGEYGGGNNEIHWVACTSFNIAQPELPPLTTASATGPGLTENKYWQPNDKALAQAQKLNAKNIKATKGGGDIAIVAGGKMVLIGEGHDDDHGNYVRRQKDIEEGIIHVTKSSAFVKGAGKLEVKGITAAKQDLVKNALNEFSDKEVTFI
jgi:hypothetical protein